MSNANWQALKQVAKRMQQDGKSLRHIARALGIHRQTVKKLLQETETTELSPGNPSAASTAGLRPADTHPPAPAGPPPPAPKKGKPRKKRKSKLDRHQSRILELAETPGITNQSILAIIRKEGFTGGKTILDDFLREERNKKRTARAYIRYEPPPGHEAQMDWSPYTVEFPAESGTAIKVKAHVFSIILSYSRYQYLEVFLDEKQDTLFQGHLEAFRYFEGVPAQILYDNQSPVVVGRLGGKVLLHPRFESFANHYGFAPKVCRPYDPERKGRVERPFGYLATSFFPGRKFQDLEDLRQQLRDWLEGGKDEPEPRTPQTQTGDGAPPEQTDQPIASAQTGNYRIHGTTRERPVDRWEPEKPRLIALPPTDFLPTRIEERPVAKDCTVAVLGNRYTVPPQYVGQKVTVLITPKAIRFFNRRREPIAEHRIPQGKGKIVINEAHYDDLRKTRNRETRTAIEQRFLDSFPGEQAFLEGLHRHVKSIAPLHLKQLQALLEQFTREQVQHAIQRAVQHGTCTTPYVEEVLRRQFPSQFCATPFDEKLQKPTALTLGPLDLGETKAFDHIFPPSLLPAEGPAPQTQQPAETASDPEADPNPSSSDSHERSSS